MSPSDARATIAELLRLVDGPAEPRADLRTLARCLDRLVLAMNLEEPPESGPTERDAEPPRADCRALYERVAARFPELGLYTAPSLEPGEGPLTGDAVDDLADIALELGEVAWLWEHAGETEALHHLHFTFRIHWGEHLRALQWVLHALAPPESKEPR